MSRASTVTDTLSVTRHHVTLLQLGIVLSCIAMGMILWRVTTQSIVLPLNRAIHVAQAVAGGKLDNLIDTSGRDETAQLLSQLQPDTRSYRDTLQGRAVCERCDRTSSYA